MHFIYCNQVCGGLYNPTICARWIHYNMFDPTTSPGGVFINGFNGLSMQFSPFAESGMYPNLAVDENGRMIGVADQVTDAKAWYLANRDGAGVCSCCGIYTGGFPGNVNCDTEGKRNLADITKLIECIYISPLTYVECLCCPASANINADEQKKYNLADITKLIDHVYISKAQTPACL